MKKYVEVEMLAVFFVLTLMSLFTAASARAQTVIYSQTSLAGSTGVTPGLFDQLGLLAGPDFQRRDFYEIFTNNTGTVVRINKVVIYGSVNTISTAVLVPLITGTANGFPNILLPDTNPDHVLSSASVPIGPTAGPGTIDITFSPAVNMPAGGQLAFGFFVPMVTTVDAALFGTDTLSNEFSSTTPPYYTGFYCTSAFGELGLCNGNHYLVIESVPASEPPAGGIIAGLVKSDSGGAGIGNVRVRVYGAAEMPMPPMLVGETQSDASGNYRMSGLQTGTYFVCFDGSAGSYINECYDNKPWNLWSDISYATPVDVISGQTTTLHDELLTQGGGIAGTVTNSHGAGIAMVSVSVYDSNNMWVKQVQTGPTGTYRVGGLPTGDYKVCFDANMMMTGYLNECYNDRAWGDIANATPVPVAAGQTAQVDASLTQGGVITGAVKNESNAGIGNVWVQIFDMNGMPTPMPMPAGSMTDPGGTYRVGGLQTGVYKVCFDGSSSGYTKECYNDKPWNTWNDIVSADTVTVTADQETALDVAVLTSGGILRGQVTGDCPTGIANVWVHVCRYDSVTGMCDYAGMISTDPEGNYAVGGLATGSYKIWFDTSMLLMMGSNYLSQWYNNKVDEAGADLVTITAPAASTINVQLEQGGRISGTVTNGSIGLQGIWVSAYDSSGMPLPLMGMGATTNMDGAFSVGGLRTGTYKVCFDGSSSGYINECYNDKPWNAWSDIASATSVPVVTSQTTTLGDVVVLAQGGAISGFVKNESGTAIGMVTMSVYDTNNMWIRGTTTDWTGGYSIGGLPTGSYKVCFDAMMTMTYLSECYDNQAWMDLANATPVPVDAGQTKILNDAVLAQGRYYNVWVNGGPGGFISPPMQSVVNGSTAQFIVSPYEGFDVSSVSGCGGTWTGTNPYVTGPINSDCLVTATFSQKKASYQFIGFLPPIANDGSSIFKSGRTVPIKFQLTGADGLFVANAQATLRVYKVSNDILGTTNVDSSGSGGGDTSFRYDFASNQYIHNMSTSAFGTGTFMLRVDLDDGSVHEVRISLR